MLVGYLSLLSVAISTSYLIFDYFYGLQEAYTVYYIFLSGATLSFLVNRTGYHFISKVILLSIALGVVFVFSTRGNFETDTHFFYIIISISGFGLFGHEQRWASFLFSGASILLFIFSFTTGFDVAPAIVYSESYIRANQIINFSMVFVASSIILYMLVKLNHQSEEKLQKKQCEVTQQNEALTKANSELDRFVYSASHDLRSPLMSILGLTNIARHTNKPEEIQQYLDMIASRVHNLDDFLHEIIDFSRNSRTEVVCEDVAVRNLVENISENLKYTVTGKPIHIEIDIPETLKIKTDTARLTVVLNNLIGNAIKYHDARKEGPFIAIDALRTEAGYKLSVCDNGIGIETEHQSKIFDMFYRASEQSKGSGLGLYIVKETIEKLSGSIQLYSKPGLGTTFTVILPEN
jgi:signal transduction histidine kinase